MFSKVKADLFSASDDFSLAHCVSSDLRMGAGIAVEFRNRFGQIDKLKSQNPKVGSFVYLWNEGRYIFYLITKENYYDKPTYEDLTLSLIQLCEFCLDRKINKLAMPKIGSGLDQLEWERVKRIIEEVFDDTNIEICIHTLK